MSAAPLSAPGDDALGLYVHWPFCLSKCPYCDFNSHVAAEIDEPRWRRALLAELDRFAALAEGRRLETIFFGGGTPSLMRPETVAAVIERAVWRWPAAPGLEVTLEANPGAAEAAKLGEFRAAGVNRLSLGAQSFAPEGLAALGRAHGVGEAAAALAAARGLFPRTSFDLIYARPGQTPQAWRAELARALDHVPGDGTAHLSAYELTIEPGTAFHARRRAGALDLPPEDDRAAMYETVQELLGQAGLPAYEVSNHAAPGMECRHNLIYWLSGDYVGVGPGAHSRLTAGGATTAFAQRRAPSAWLAGVEADGHATGTAEPLTARERLEEVVMMGLRLVDGLARPRFAALVGAPPEDALESGALARLVEGGFVENDARGLRATPRGLRRLDAVLAALLA